MIVKFGPLIRLWTMRFESKHSYFKKCARTLQNFKNVTQSLARKHELLQPFYSTGYLFPPSLKLVDSQAFNIQKLDKDVKSAFAHLDFSHVTTERTKSILFKGTEYKKDQEILLDKNDEGFVVGKIVKIFVQHMTDMYFEVKCYHLFQSQLLGFCLITLHVF